MLKPALQGVDRGRAKLKLRVVDVKVFVSRDSIAFASQRASPATYTWVKVDGVQNYESRLADFQIGKHNFVNEQRPFSIENPTLDLIYE
jgi:hypothetical protein